jgi:hypothetical protein
MARQRWPKPWRMMLTSELGENPLSIVSDLIESLSSERPGLENINIASAKLGQALGDRRILLLVDDVWREQDLRPFMQGGTSTTRLITTRNDSTLPANAVRQSVDAMRGSEALELIENGLPAPLTQRRELTALAARLGEWPLLLKLVNGFLRDRVLQLKQSLPSAIVAANKRLDEKGFIAFDARNDSERTKAVALTIGVSLELLDPRGRERFAELGIFAEDAHVPIGAHQGAVPHSLTVRLSAKRGEPPRRPGLDFLRSHRRVVGAAVNIKASASASPMIDR